MTATATILLARVDLMSEIFRYFYGRSKALTLTEFDWFTIVDDGDTRWLVETRDYRHEVAEVLHEAAVGIVAGEFDDRLGHAKWDDVIEELYVRLVRDCPAIFSTNGGALADIFAISRDHSMYCEICEALKI